MKIVYTLSDFKKYRETLDNDAVVGFVPTMGALHEGHISLIKKAKEKCTIVVCSIFVNPTQFNKKEDLDKYPRTENEDIEFLKKAGADCVFLPKTTDLYANSYFLRFDFGHLEQVMEGKFRPGHFNGVATVVAKLFHVVTPNIAYFGQKDIQQIAVIKDLVKALHFDLEIISCPTIRDKNGLALSSRNARLTEKEKEEAAVINKTLKSIVLEVTITKNIEESLKKGTEFFKKTTGFYPEYIELVDIETLQCPNNLDANVPYVVCIATPFGAVRLLDNEIFIIN